MHVNTLLVQQGVAEAEPVWAKPLSDEDRCGLTALFWSNVNPYSTFRLDMDQHLDLGALTHPAESRSPAAPSEASPDDREPAAVGFAVAVASPEALIALKVSELHLLFPVHVSRGDLPPLREGVVTYLGDEVAAGCLHKARIVQDALQPHV
ncbi:hypothetical protein [Streptomyces sp. SID10853]|uniref:hypothetical protein n=1 Tax=Streptomyces sp. SID10853 TaxID=2706028 RepID=UPI0019441ED7|nr:hypothetical protein [Streptomyces sp. SID10853]